MIKSYSDSGLRSNCSSLCNWTEQVNLYKILHITLKFVYCTLKSLQLLVVSEIKFQVSSVFIEDLPERKWCDLTCLLDYCQTIHSDTFTWCFIDKIDVVLLYIDLTHINATILRLSCVRLRFDARSFYMQIGVAIIL